MKYLKRFNEELRSSTYQSAADKLRKIGHPRRSTKIGEWAMKKENLENLEKWKANVEKYSKFGKFKFNISGKPTNYIKLLMTDEFYILINFDDGTFEQEVSDKRSDQYVRDVEDELDDEDDEVELDDDMDILNMWGDVEVEPEPYRESKESQSKFPYEWSVNLNLAIALIPINEESVNRCKEELEDKAKGYLSPDFHNGSYWSNWLTFTIKASGEKISVSPMEIFDYDESQLGYVNIDDRKSAGMFKNLLIGIFSGNIKYPSGYPEGVSQGGWTSIPDMHELLETTICNTSDLSSEYGLDMNHFVEALRKTPTNSLFKEVEESTHFGDIKK